MRRLYGRKKQWIGMGLAIMGGHYFGGFQATSVYLEKCKAFKCRVVVRSAVTLAGLLTIYSPIYRMGYEFLIYLKIQKDFGKLSYSVYWALR